MDRYETLLALQHAVRDSANAHRADLVWAKDVQKNRDFSIREISERVDDLVLHIVEHFAGVDDMVSVPMLVQQVNDLFDRKLIIDTFDEAVLRQTDDALVSIAVMRAVISDYKAPLDTSLAEHYHLFSARFRGLIMAARPVKMWNDATSLSSTQKPPMGHLHNLSV